MGRHNIFNVQRFVKAADTFTEFWQTLNIAIPQYASFRHLTVDPKDLVRVVLFNKIDRVFASLIHGCRYEHIYGISSRTALLLVASFSPC